MKKVYLLFLSLAAMFAMGVAFTSCNKDNGGNDDSGSSEIVKELVGTWKSESYLVGGNWFDFTLTVNSDGSGTVADDNTLDIKFSSLREKDGKLVVISTDTKKEVSATLKSKTDTELVLGGRPFGSYYNSEVEMTKQENNEDN